MTAEAPAAAETSEAPIKDAPIQIAESTASSTPFHAGDFLGRLSQVTDRRDNNSIEPSVLDASRPVFASRTVLPNFRGINSVTDSSRGVGPDGRPIESTRPGEGDKMKAVERGDRIQTTDQDKVMRDYTELLTRSGMSPTDAANAARRTLERLTENFRNMPGDQTNTHGLSPENRALEQMARLHRAMAEVQTGSRGPNDPLGQTERNLFVQDMALRMMDPERFANQGAHNTCALQALQKQMMSGGDPARFAEHLAMIANHGVTTINGQEVRVDPRGLVADREARENPLSRVNGNILNGTVRDGRGMAGLIGDALLGQLAADMRGRGEIYLTSNAQALGAPSDRSSTGEGLFTRNGRFLSSSPAMEAADVLRVGRAYGLPPGSFFLHESMRYQVPAELQSQAGFFSDAGDLRRQLAELQRVHGISGSIGVNAPFLPGGGMDGHGLHAVNISLKNGQLFLDNNWSHEHNQGISDDQLMLAADERRWTRGGVPGAERIPGDVPTRFGPDTGTNPNHERVRNQQEGDVYRDRVKQLAEQEQSRLRELSDKLRAERPQDSDRVREQVDNLQRALAEFQRLYDQWTQDRAGDRDFSKAPPDFNAIFYRVSRRSA